ncbi:hypothetical protein CZP2022_45 [Vibrio phage C-ZP2022]|nr:hypothetical protein CZP2022_45 [Vibrio phage C-ZP2022]
MESVVDSVCDSIIHGDSVVSHQLTEELRQRIKSELAAKLQSKVLKRFVVHSQNFMLQDSQVITFATTDEEPVYPKATTHNTVGEQDESK